MVGIKGVAAMFIIQVLAPQIHPQSLVPFDIRQELTGLHLRAERHEGLYLVNQEHLEEALGKRSLSPQLTGYLSALNGLCAMFEAHEVRLCEDLKNHPY